MTVPPHRAELSNGEFSVKLDGLMRNKPFLIGIAKTCDTAYKKAEITKAQALSQPPAEWLSQPTFSPEEEVLLLKDRSSLPPPEQAAYDKAQLTLSINTAGFYATQEGISVLSKIKNVSVNTLLAQIADGKMSTEDMLFMCQFAHATWATSQPFRNRETRDVMKPFDSLSEDEKIKDRVQIVAAAGFLLDEINKPLS